MKTKFYTLLFLTLTYALHSEAKTLNQAVRSFVNWSAAGTWSQNRVPASGDSVVIPSGYIVFLDIKPTLNNVDVMVAGALEIDANSGLVLDQWSEVVVQNGALMNSTSFAASSVITIGGATKFQGNKDGFLTGPATANKNTGNSPSGFTSNPVSLPVTWVAFAAVRTGEAVTLDWSTVNEKNNSHFEVERSVDGSNWSTIGTVEAGVMGQADRYSYTDETAGTAATWYRLRQVDLDGQSEYSKVVTVGGTNAMAATRTTIYAAGKTINIRFAEPTSSRVTVRLVSMGGQVLQQETLETASGTMSLSASNLPAGIYVVYLADGKGLSTAQKVML
jgi:G8 domain-containing protein/type IX secretion system substrate protein